MNGPLTSSQPENLVWELPGISHAEADPARCERNNSTKTVKTKKRKT